jgi:diphthamide biosynthesis protein 3
MSEVMPLMASYLHNSVKTLATMSSNDSELLELSHLVPQVASISNSIVAQSTAVTTTRNRIMEIAEQIHIVHRDIMEASIRILEQTMHGSVARGIKARVEHLATVAKGLDYKIQILAKSDPLLNDDDVKASLQAYSSSLSDTLKDLKSQVNTASNQLDEYEHSGSGMDQIATKYADIMLKSENLKQEIKKLEN